MFFQQHSSNLSCLSYLYGCLTSAEAIAVDVVAGDEDWFLEEARKRYVTIRYVIDTHIHADHKSGGRALAEKAGGEYCLHSSAKDFVSFGFRPLEDGYVLESGKVQTTVLHTPGHTKESICLKVTDRRRGDDPWVLLTGDTLFIGSVGRSDLAGEAEVMAGRLFDSLKKHILPLDDCIEIWPAHGPGTSCASEVSGKTSSCLGFEKKYAPFLKIQSKEEFIRELIGSRIFPPNLMEENVKFNRGLGGKIS